MDALITRINQDISKINELSRITNNRIRIIRTSGNPVNRIEIELKFLTAPSQDYPARRQTNTFATIDLPAKYPFTQPKVTFKPPVFHPNVFSSGLVCLGNNWLPTEFLDLLVKRLARILTFDPLVIDVNSPASWEAVKWYLKTKHERPSLFPTENLVAVFAETPARPRIAWREIN